jgi:gas vesicle protein
MGTNMPKSKGTANLSKSDNEQPNSSNEILKTILREIKEQNTSFREETKKELGEIREELKTRQQME